MDQRCSRQCLEQDGLIYAVHRLPIAPTGTEVLPRRAESRAREVLNQEPLFSLLVHFSIPVKIFIKPIGVIFYDPTFQTGSVLTGLYTGEEPNLTFTEVLTKGALTNVAKQRLILR